jgi:ABC-type branched-subunit amino acid transport system substrate-binding protein
MEPTQRTPERGRRRWRRLAPLSCLGALCLLASACSNASSTSSAAAAAPGVHPHVIDVGALASESGLITAGFGDIVDGVRAYFDWVDAHGGVDGRRIVLADVGNDQSNPTVDTEVARTLVEQDHVFAIVGVGTAFFSAASYLASTGTPTFGYVVSNVWSKAPNLFGTYGSVIDYSTNGSTVAWVAHQLGVTTAAVVAYGGIAESTGACQADARELPRFGVSVPVQDDTFTLGGDPDAVVAEMVRDHVGLLVSCLDGADSLSFAKAMHQYGLGDAWSLWQSGYSRSVVAANPTATDHVIFQLEHVPFEAGTLDPKQYPGMVTYLKEMNRYEPAWTYHDTAFQGWVNAAQFVAGLRAVGHHRLTQQALVRAINQETAFNAGGLIPPVNWREAHTVDAPPYCSSFVVAESGRIAPMAALEGPHHELLVCFTATSDHPVTPPPGTPGT